MRSRTAGMTKKKEGSGRCPAKEEIEKNASSTLMTGRAEAHRQKKRQLTFLVFLKIY